MTSGHIEPIGLAAAGPLSVLHRSCFPEDPWDVRAIIEIIGIPGFFGRISFEEDLPAGFAMALDLGSECELLSLGVMHDRRRAGIGSSLLNCICREARLRGAASVVLEVAVDNDAARSLYVAHGFTVAARRQNYYRQAGGTVDALILRLALTTASLGT